MCVCVCVCVCVDLYMFLYKSWSSSEKLPRGRYFQDQNQINLISIRLLIDT